MIYGNLNNLGNLITYPRAIAKALEYLSSKDSTKLDIGKYEIEGKDLYITISYASLDRIENKKPESHKKYIDIQLSPNGGELMGFAVDTGNNPVSQDLTQEKDVVFYKSVENEQFIKMNSNDFFVFYPWDIHRPGCTGENPTEVKKIVVKIKMDII